MDSQANTHQHMLGSLNYMAVRSQEVSLLERLESKIIIIKVTVINKLRLYQISVVSYDFKHIFSYHRGSPTDLVLVVPQSLCHSDNIF